RKMRRKSSIRPYAATKCSIGPPRLRKVQGGCHGRKSMKARTDGSGEGRRRANSTFGGHRDYRAAAGEPRRQKNGDAAFGATSPGIFLAPQTLPRAHRIETASR